MVRWCQKNTGASLKEHADQNWDNLCNKKISMNAKEPMSSYWYT